MVRKIWDKNKFRKKTDEEVFKKYFLLFDWWLKDYCIFLSTLISLNSKKNKVFDQKKKILVAFSLTLQPEYIHLRQ